MAYLLYGLLLYGLSTLWPCWILPCSLYPTLSILYGLLYVYCPALSILLYPTLSYSMVYGLLLSPLRALFVHLPSLLLFPSYGLPMAFLWPSPYLWPSTLSPICGLIMAYLLSLALYWYCSYLLSFLWPCWILPSSSTLWPLHDIALSLLSVVSLWPIYSMALSPSLRPSLSSSVAMYWYCPYLLSMALLGYCPILPLWPFVGYCTYLFSMALYDICQHDTTCSTQPLFSFLFPGLPPKIQQTTEHPLAIDIKK